MAEEAMAMQAVLTRGVKRGFRVLRRGVRMGSGL